MPNALTLRAWSPVRALGALNGALVVCYLGLIATAMAYAALEVEFTQYTKTDEAQVATLEAQYLDAIARVTATDYHAEGYAAPVALTFVAGAPETAVNIR